MTRDPSSDRAPFAVIDVDGVLADVRHRLAFVERKPKDWDGFFAAALQDPPLELGIRRVRALAVDHEIVYVTGRPERCREETLRWFQRHGVPNGALHMRPDSDRRPARIYKRETCERLASIAPVAVVVDDDRAVVNALRDAGFTVEHADWMGVDTDGEDAAPTLLRQAAEEGRT